MNIQPANERDMEEVVRVINERGYFVIRTKTRREIGQVVNSFHRTQRWANRAVKIDQPHTIVSETDWSDMRGQLEAFQRYKLELGQRLIIQEPSRPEWYYRVVFD